MSASYSWAVVAWLGGIVTGIGLADDLSIPAFSGAALSGIGFYCIKKSKEPK